MSVYKKLQQARIQLQNSKLTKSGKNKFAGYEYFELGDFLPVIQKICQEIGLCGILSFTADTAYLTIHETDGDGFITFTSPMSTAALKGCHEVQNLGAVQTYLRRYLWTNAFEIVEHDALDATTGVVEPAKKVSWEVPAPTKPITVAPKVTPVSENKPMSGNPGEFQLKVSAKPEGDPTEWLELVKTASGILLDLASCAEDVMIIFKKNKVIFDEVKATDPEFFKGMMAKFTETTNKFKE